MRLAFDICQPSGELGEEESALAQCFMAIAGFVRKMSGTSDVDADTMNRKVSKMVEEALKYNKVESVLETGEEEDIFSPEYFEKLSDIKMPATKLEILVKMLRKEIKEYSRINKIAAKTFQEMLEETIAEYHERRKHLTQEEAGETQEKASEDILKVATERALEILRQMNENKESFRKLGLTFEEKAFYDILKAVSKKFEFEYPDDKMIELSKRIKLIVDDKSRYTDWSARDDIKANLQVDLILLLDEFGYPPVTIDDVYKEVLEQAENFKKYAQ